MAFTEDSCCFTSILTFAAQCGRSFVLAAGHCEAGLCFSQHVTKCHTFYNRVYNKVCLLMSRSWPDSLVPHFLLTGLTNADILDCPGCSGIVVVVGCGLIKSLWIFGCFLCKIKQQKIVLNHRQ